MLALPAAFPRPVLLGATWVGVMRQKRKSKKLSLGKKTLLSIGIQIESILGAQHSSQIELLELKPIARDDGNFVLGRYICGTDPDNNRSRLFAIQRFGDCCDVWLAGPEADDESPYNDAA